MNKNPTNCLSSNKSWRLLRRRFFRRALHFAQTGSLFFQISTNFRSWENGWPWDFLTALKVVSLPKKQVKQVAPLHQMTGTLSLDLQLWQHVPQDFGDPTFSRGRISPQKKNQVAKGGLKFHLVGWFWNATHLGKYAQSRQIGEWFSPTNNSGDGKFSQKSLSCHGSRLPGYQFSPCQDAKLLGTSFRELVSKKNASPTLKTLTSIYNSHT